MKPDWTCSEDGLANSSPEFLEITREVEDLIVASANMLVRGRVRGVAQRIVSHLAHARGMSPSGQLSAGGPGSGEGQGE